MRLISMFCVAALCASIDLLGATLGLTIVDAKGDPVSGATVTVVRQSIYLPASPGSRPQLAAGEVSYGASWVTNNTGMIQASSIPAGSYLLCVQKPNSALLDPCQWAKPITVSSLQAQEQRDLGKIAVQMGALTTITVADPQQLLPAWDTISSDGGLIAGLFHDNRNWTPAVRNSNKTFTFAAPLGSSYQLWLFSRNFTFSFSGPSPSTLGAGLLTPFIIAGNEPPSGYQVTITGQQQQ